MNPLRLLVLLVSLPLLLGGCGGDKKEPVGETIVDPIVNLLSEEELARAYDYNKLEEREGLKYLKGSETPYTGISFELYENGQRAWEFVFKEGKFIRMRSFDEKGKMTSDSGVF
ncbi:MAG: hypothetical protein P8I97_00550 [Verrucomicrobiales bacterium]|nr:hypothetical protein [Verrucomicrobiales bacterium]